VQILLETEDFLLEDDDELLLLDDQFLGHVVLEEGARVE
jgi:hypothetical protein